MKQDYKQRYNMAVEEIHRLQTKILELEYEVHRLQKAQNVITIVANKKVIK